MSGKSGNEIDNIDDETIIKHVLPEDAGGQTKWFENLNDFEQQETRRQIKFKKKIWGDIDPGPASKHKNRLYPHILPAEYPLTSAFFGGFAEDVLKYFKKSDIAPHSELLNLRSSQAACVNFLFPLRQDHDLAARVFSKLRSSCAEVVEVEFEYCGDRPADARKWLGEPPGGKRGQNQTSIDAAIIWRDSKGQKNSTLIEWKYTERGYGNCSAYADASASDKKGCQEIQIATDRNPKGKCLLTTGTPRRNRTYWEKLETSGINKNAFKGLTGCPFRDEFYQLMRQFLFAQYLREEEGFVGVDVMSISFAANESLSKVRDYQKPLLPTDSGTVVDAWNSILQGVPRMEHRTVSELIQWYEQGQDFDPSWRAYLKARYGV